MDPDTRYYYDEDRCQFVKVERGWSDHLRTAGLVLGLALTLTAVAAWAIDAHLILTPHERALQSKNEALQKQLARVDDQMSTLSDKLDRLATKDRNVYRTLLQIEPISKDVREVGVGGTDLYEEYDHLGGDTGEILRKTSKKLDKLERQVSLQGTSYRELEHAISQRRKQFDQLPAIRPSNGRIVSGYGMRHHPILNVRKMHAGVDFLLRTGTPVMATANGVIRRAQFSPTYGKYVDIYHEDAGYMTRYAHLSEFADGIRRGVRVERGEEIALSGNTGRSTGPHLHYEVRKLDNKRTLNPMNFFVPDMTPKQYHRLEQRTEEFQARAQKGDAPSNETPMDEGGEVTASR
jgi:murein DD-endopeptidase MepM/ murein hydrolase activator NlpD